MPFSRVGCRLQNSSFSYSVGHLLVMSLLSISASVSAGVSVSGSGAATYSMGITVPPGVAGVEPKLSFNYSSQSGIGIMGQGWSLSGLSAITRCSKTFLQDSFDRPVLDSNGNGTTTTADSTTSTTDGFCLDGQRLIKSDGSTGIANGSYRTERESYSQITYNSSSDQWTVNTKGGNTMIYGGAGAKAPGSNGVTRTWVVRSINDQKNNVITFNYMTGNSASDLFISSITYGPANTNAINFKYDPRTTDTQESYLNGIRNVNNQRLRMIQVAIGTQEVRRYLLSYNVQQDGVTAVNNVTGHSILSKLQECVPVSGNAGTVYQSTANNTKSSQQKCLPPTKFTYWDGAISVGLMNSSAYTPSFTDGAGYSNADYYNTFQFADLDSDGLSDLCFRDNFTPANGLTCNIAVLGANGLPSYTSAKQWTLPAFNSAAYFGSLQFTDSDGDGKLDACSRFSDGVRCYKNTGTGFGSTPVLTGPFTDQWVSDQSFPDASTITFLELNNDGYVDACGRGLDGLQCFTNAKNGAFNAAYVISELNSRTGSLLFDYFSNGSSVQSYTTIRYADVSNSRYKINLNRISN
jgi:Salmonella virulence plasmid 65kDa B protein